MDFIYFLVLLIIILIVFLKYKKTVSKLHQENIKLKNQIENQKCINFNSNIEINSQKQREIENRKYKIIEFLSKYETITNNQVENLLKVSDSTAYRLLENLERENKIMQIGNTGKDVYYILNKFYKQN